MKGMRGRGVESCYQCFVLGIIAVLRKGEGDVEGLVGRVVVGACVCGEGKRMGTGW